MKEVIGLYLLVITFLLISPKIDAVSITKHRLFLDQTERLTDMRVFNSESVLKVCNIRLKDVGFTGDSLSLGSEFPRLPNPTGMVRLAPRTFELDKNQDQAFKVVYRRKPGVKAGEYIGVVAISCADKENTGDSKVNIKPQLVHNVPLVVRVGQLDAEVTFNQLIHKDDFVNVDVSIRGERSTTGSFEVYDKNSGELLAKKTKVSFYPQSPGKKIAIYVGNKTTSRLEVIFRENKKSGDLVIKGDVTLL